MAQPLKEDAGNDENNWDGWDKEENEDNAQCLFSNDVFPSAKLALEHAKVKYNFDFSEHRSRLGLDFYGCMRLINYIRALTKQGLSASETITKVSADTAWLSDEAFLIPVIPDDTLLFDFDGEDDDFDDEDESATRIAPSEDASRGIEQYKNENQLLKQQVEQMKEVIERMGNAFNNITDSKDLAGDSSSDEEGLPEDVKSTPQEDTKKKALKKKKTGLKLPNPNDAGYFENYGHRDIHETMLKDKTRTLAYRDFMYKNKDVFKDKVVLDIGCGTGILSMFAARAGAKQVIGIDAADIIDKARVIIKENQLDSVITLVKSKVEEAVLPVEKVDLIVSEWMGYFLLYESMLPSVLFARDKWCIPGGGVYPNKARMFLGGADLSAKKSARTEFWQDVYGFNYTSLIDEREKISGSTVDEVEASDIITDSTIIKELDMQVCNAPDLEFTTSFELTLAADRTLDAFVVWFDTTFDYRCKEAVVLDTAPSGPDTPITHWFQAIFNLFVPLQTKAGDVVVGTITAKRHKDCDRDYDVNMSYGLKDAPADQVYLQDFHV